MPDFNYRATLDALNFEIYGLDQNYKDVGGIGGNNSTHQQGRLCVCVCVCVCVFNGSPCPLCFSCVFTLHVQRPFLPRSLLLLRIHILPHIVNKVCGGGDGALGTRLAAIGHSGEALLASGAAKGANDPAKTRNVLVLQHYPGLCASLKAKFVASLPAGERGNPLDFKCSFGHVHNTTCESGTASECEFAMIGGGGGCCANDVTNSQAGFGLLTFNPDGGMNVELLRLGRHCNMQPTTGQ